MNVSGLKEVPSCALPKQCGRFAFATISNFMCSFPLPLQQCMIAVHALFTPGTGVKASVLDDWAPRMMHVSLNMSCSRAHRLARTMRMELRASSTLPQLADAASPT